MTHRICPTCQTRNSAQEFFCNACGASISSVELTIDTPPVQAEPEGSLGQPAAAEGTGPAGLTHCPDCGLQQPPAPHCARCDGSLPIEHRWMLTWPWGEETVLSGALAIGRDSSPEWLRERYRRNGLDNLSRRHAVVEVNGAEGHVVDLGSSNGTFLNDNPVSPHVRTALRAGDELRFASRLRVTVALRASS
jgi:hypothetical protein